MDQVIPLNHATLTKLNKFRSNNNQKASIRAHFQHQRAQSDAPSPELQQSWFRSMKNVLEEVDQALRFIPQGCRFHFLDVGCCPGGFSSYILSKNSKATGVGLSLDVESGGHAYLLEEELQPRLELYLADITYYQLGAMVFHDPRLKYLPFNAHNSPFDMVLLDGHPLRTSVGCTSYTGDRLIISQLIICLQTISMSGTIVMKLSKPERVITAKILYMLDNLSLSLACWKPVCMHATRPTFYAVAKGVGYGKQGYRLPQLLHGLKLLWTSLTYGGAKGSGRPINATDLDFIVRDMDLQSTFGDRLQRLSEPIWLVQEQSYRSWVEVEGL